MYIISGHVIVIMQGILFVDTIFMDAVNSVLYGLDELII